MQDINAQETINQIYANMSVRPTFTDLETSEMIKYASNCFNAAKISYVNEIWYLASQLKLDGNLILGLASQAAEGYWNSKYGTLGGRPFGGTCLPKDTSGLLSFAEQLGIDMPLLEAVIEVNSRMEELARLGRASAATVEGPHRISAPNNSTIHV